MAVWKLVLAGVGTVALTAFAGCSTKTVNWAYTVRANKGDTVFDMTGVTLVFLGRQCVSPSNGSIMVYCYKSPFDNPVSTINAQTGAGNPQPTVDISRTYARITFLGHNIRALNQGKGIKVDGRAFSLAGPKKTIVVPPSGEPYVRAAPNI